MNANLCAIDALMNQGKISFHEAVRGWRLVRKGRTGEEVAAIVLAQKAKKEEKNMKKKNRESLETLVGFLKVAVEYFHSGEGEDTWAAPDDAMSHISHEATERLNAPCFDEDTKALMESNQDSLGMWS